MYDIAKDFWAKRGYNPADYKYECDISDESRGPTGLLWWPDTTPAHKGGHSILFMDGHAKIHAVWDDEKMTRMPPVN